MKLCSISKCTIIC